MGFNDLMGSHGILGDLLGDLTINRGFDGDLEHGDMGFLGPDRDNDGFHHGLTMVKTRYSWTCPHQ